LSARFPPGIRRAHQGLVFSPSRTFFQLVLQTSQCSLLIVFAAMTRAQTIHHHFNGAVYSNKGAVVAAHVPGSHSYVVNGTPLPATFGLGTPLLPNTPLGTITGSSISGGVAVVYAAQSRTLMTNAWSTNYVSGHGLIAIGITGQGVNFREATAPAYNSSGFYFDLNQRSVTLPAFSMTSPICANPKLRWQTAR